MTIRVGLSSVCSALVKELQDAGFPVGIQADELNWVDTFGFREQVFVGKFVASAYA